MNMDKIRIKDKVFRRYISKAEIARTVKRLAQRIQEDLKGEQPLFIVMLNGAFVFAADLLRAMEGPCEIDFMRMKSYEGTSTTGKVDLLQPLHSDVKGRTVIVVEDIVDSGTTMWTLLHYLEPYKPKCVKIAALLLKPKALRHDIKVDYAAFEIPDDFVVGYGLDYDERGRNLKDIYTLTEEGQTDK